MEFGESNDIGDNYSCDDDEYENKDYVDINFLYNENTLVMLANAPDNNITTANDECLNHKL
ncbi:hypothetical protein Glove_159g25 [Diversispora epigaea]|uniref:Uncharacterized protein n=1 Tax=Diversispora epigaea TaxID=1348612 RepID=A0A397IW54_9GLOM|nr:hypothetical protein Glove_159g25 [Diversispora epigaea]